MPGTTVFTRDNFDVSLSGDSSDFTAALVYAPEANSRDIDIRHFFLVGSYCFRDTASLFDSSLVLDVCGSISIKCSRGRKTTEGMKVLKHCLESRMLAEVERSPEENAHFWISFDLCRL